MDVMNGTVFASHIPVNTDEHVCAGIFVCIANFFLKYSQG